MTPGNYNLGIFINIKRRDNEEYQLTHPTAYLGGIIRGSLSVTVSDRAFVICPKTRIKAILNYAEESWLGKTQNKVNGVIFNYDPENDNKNRIKDVPEKDVLAKLEGAWHDEVYYTLAGSKVPSPPLQAPNIPSNHSHQTGPHAPPRPQTSLPLPQDNSPPRLPTLQRIPPLLGPRHHSHQIQTLRRSHKTKTRARRTAAREGNAEEREECGVEA